MGRNKHEKISLIISIYLVTLFVISGSSFAAQLNHYCPATGCLPLYFKHRVALGGRVIPLRKCLGRLFRSKHRH